MIRFAIRVVLSAFVLTFVLPMIGGFHFTGGFWPEGIIYGVLLAVVSWAVALGLAAFTVGTLGLGCIVIGLCFWLIPALQLELLAWLFPQHLTIDSFGTAILAGLVLLVVNMLTSTRNSTSSSSN